MATLQTNMSTKTIPSMSYVLRFIAETRNKRKVKQLKYCNLL